MGCLINLIYPLLSGINEVELERLTLSIIMQVLLRDSLKGLVLSSLGLIRDSDYKCFLIKNSESLFLSIHVLHISATVHLRPTYGRSWFISLDTCPIRVARRLPH